MPLGVVSPITVHLQSYSSVLLLNESNDPPTLSHAACSKSLIAKIRYLNKSDDSPPTLLHTLAQSLIAKNELYLIRVATDETSTRHIVAAIPAVSSCSNLCLNNVHFLEHMQSIGK